MEVFVDRLLKEFENGRMSRRQLIQTLALAATTGAGDTPNYVSFHVTDPDGLGVQISGIARPGDSLDKRP